MKQYLKCLIAAALVALAVTAPQKVAPLATHKDEPKGEISAANVVVPDPPKPEVATKPTSPVKTAGTGSCEAEIAKYSWNVNVATAVSRAESGLGAGRVNNNPRTRDYSVGCFQINIYGSLAKNRPSEAWLKVAANNVQYAFQMYSAKGGTFITDWRVCDYKVSCY